MKDTISLIRDFLRSDWELSQTVMKRVHLEDGQVLFRQGDVGDAFYLIESGQLRIYTYNHEGKEITLNTISTGETLGEMSLVDDQPRSASVVSIGSSTLLRLDRNEFLQRVRNHRELNQLIIQLLSQRIRYSIEYIERLGYWTQLIIDGKYNQVIRSIEKVNSQGNRALVAVANSLKQMLKTMQQREQSQRQEVVKLKLEIDEYKRQQQVEEIISSEYFDYLTQLAEQRRSLGIIKHSGEGEGKIFPFRKSVTKLNYKENWSQNPEIRKALAKGLKNRSEVLNSLIIKAWEDEDFRQELLTNSRAVYAREFGCELPEELVIEVIEETLDTFKMVLPRNPILEMPEEELSAQDLDAVAGGCWANTNNLFYKQQEEN
ncbi:MAG: cyclic nucleotide-binding domain-containing protein [Symploca sp. SIO2E9]|nr:cyclic nucleotide-binding domain-containing protein [Symploca sp. SIO2E9]